jgi:hypothetical protein
LTVKAISLSNQQQSRLTTLGKPAYEVNSAHFYDPSQKDYGLELYLSDNGPYLFDVRKNIRLRPGGGFDLVAEQSL